MLKPHIENLEARDDKAQGMEILLSPDILQKRLSRPEPCDLLDWASFLVIERLPF